MVFHSLARKGDSFIIDFKIAILGKWKCLTSVPQRPGDYGGLSGEVFPALPHPDWKG